MWNLEKWYRCTGLQGRNRDTDVENKRLDTKRMDVCVGGGGGGGEGDARGERNGNILYMYN